MLQYNLVLYEIFLMNAKAHASKYWEICFHFMEGIMLRLFSTRATVVFNIVTLVCGHSGTIEYARARP